MTSRRGGPTCPPAGRCGVKKPATHHRRSRANGNPSPAPDRRSRADGACPVLDTGNPSPAPTRRSRADGACPVLDTGNPSPATKPSFPALRGQISPLTNPHPSLILEHMSANTHTTETTTERKPPTIADIVREKTGDGALIIDFFTDVMTGRIEGAQLCHRIDAAKQLVKYGSKDAAKFLAKYKGVPCGHSINGRSNPADPCSAEERSLVAVTLNAPPTLTRDFLTVLSGIDEFLMARLIRAQTVDDVMQDRTDGFKTHHRIAAAKELIVHIVRDEQGSHTPSPSTGEGWGKGDSIVVPAKAGTQGGGGGRSTAANPARTEPVLSTAEGSVHPEPREIVVPAESLPRTRYGAGTQGGGGARSTAANPAHPELSSTVIPAKAGIQQLC